MRPPPEPPALAALLPRCRFPEPGTPVTCAVSGGADSLALLALAVAAGCSATAVHVDHGLRPGSSEEADVVRGAAARLSSSFRAVRVEVVPGPNLEARARAARRAALPEDVLLGHTADDQAETILLNLIRGAGLGGLAGIRSDGRHPLIELRRRETRALCAELGLDPVEDPTNAALVYRRNRVRHQLLPLLDDIAERDVVPVLTRAAALLAEEDQLLDELAGALDPTEGRALADAPPALARRAVRSWLRGNDDRDAEQHPPDAATVERVLDVAANRARATDVGGGRSVRRTGGRLRLVVPSR